MSKIKLILPACFIAFFACSCSEKVTGTIVARYTGEKFIKNQTLHVKITNPALRQDLSMMRSQLVKRLNEEVGALVITEVKVY